jgi:nucleoside-diphosphate-sugar epimerase
MTRPSILITGGAGFLGVNLCRHLLARGYGLRSIDIAPFDHADLGSVDAVQGDIRDRGAVEQAMAGASIVVHCAAALPRTTSEEIRSTNIEGTRLLLQSAQRHGVERFVFISSTAVYGIPDHHPILETDRLQGVGSYGKSKIVAEESCLAYRRDGLCVPILRPKTFVGPERLGVFELLYNWAYEGRNFPVLGSGDNRYQLLDVEDLCEVISLCCTRDRDVVNDTVNVAADEFGSMRDSVQAVLDRAGHGAHVVALPAAPCTLALRLLERLHLSPLYPWIYATASKDSFVSIERLKQRLGFRPRYSNRAALIRNYDWYVAHRSDFEGKTGVTHRVPWSHGALGLAKYLF